MELRPSWQNLHVPHLFLVRNWRAGGEREKGRDIRDLETGYDSISFLYILDLASYLVYNAAPFMAQDISALQLHDFLVVEMEIAAADCRAGDFADHVCGLGDGWYGGFEDSHIYRLKMVSDVKEEKKRGSKMHTFVSIPLQRKLRLTISHFGIIGSGCGTVT
jgi:hypothetical protein